MVWNKERTREPVSYYVVKIYTRGRVLIMSKNSFNSDLRCLTIAIRSIPFVKYTKSLFTRVGGSPSPSAVRNKLLAGRIVVFIFFPPLATRYLSRYDKCSHRECRRWKTVCL